MDANVAFIMAVLAAIVLFSALFFAVLNGVYSKKRKKKTVAIQKGYDAKEQQEKYIKMYYAADKMRQRAIMEVLGLCDFLFREDEKGVNLAFKNIAETIKKFRLDDPQFTQLLNFIRGLLLKAGRKDLEQDFVKLFSAGIYPAPYKFERKRKR